MPVSSWVSRRIAGREVQDRVSKNVVVTGAGGGMGSAAVRLLAERGANVLAVDRDAGALERLAAAAEDGPGEVVVRTADVGEPEQVEGFVAEAAQRWGGLDGIFNIAAILGEFTPIADTSNEGFDEVLRVNLKSVWYGMKYAIPHLIARGGGSIVNTGSYLAWHGCELLGPYNAAKHAIVGLTKTAAIEYGNSNIRVNVLCPGSMDTRMNDETAAGFNPKDPQEGLRRLAANTVTGRLTRPEEAAAVGAFLLLDAPVQMTGTLVPVDGGYSAR
jgi:NAD(P)-dependent dehydrogenase (short-subunit alcohol dehydrogenase family)